MIWDPSRYPVDATDDLVARMSAEIWALCAAEGLADSVSLGDLAHAVASYVVKEEGAVPADRRDLAVLASRALDVLGRPHAARRLLVMGSGLARPAEWEITGDGAMWILDLRRIAVRDDCALEIVFFAGMSLVVETLAECWDDAGGQGVLGLRHVCSTAAQLLGKRGEHASVQRLVDDTIHLCGAKLEQARRERAWRDVPLVINLDM